MTRPRKCECGSCPTCKNREYMRLYREAHRKAYNARMRDWYARNADTVRDRVRRYRQENIDNIRAYDRARGKLKTRDPLKESARRAARGLERQPCEECGAIRSEAHHDDYSRPHDVRWLCRRHHMALHRTVAP